jgi:eukaryotic-like serine/threonine-protein kinase
MKQGSAGSLGIPEGGPLPPLGRAERRESPPGREIWQLALADEPVARRLLRLGEAGVGGFVEGGIDREGGAVWLVRRAAGASLYERLRARKGPWPWREALALARSLATALAACEKAALFPGPLTPEAVIVDEGAATFTAAGLVAALVGAADSASRSGGTVSPLWIPPAQADGAPWDAAANRYALGLLLYRMLAGEHPFAGAGLRHAFDEAAHREAPPFREAVATELPAGLQSFCLRMLGAEGRPASAREVEQELAAFSETETSPTPALPLPSARGSRPVSPAGTSDPPRPRPKPRATPPTPGKKRGVRRYWPLAAGAAVALAAITAVLAGPAQQPDRGAASLPVAPEPPLTERHTAATDCASCHPRQAAEWRRSVMAHAVKSPLFNALESLIEEQAGRDQDCPNGAGILRKVNTATACRDPASNLPVTGSGGEHWCVNCHSPTEKLDTALPAWEGRAGGDPRTRRPVRDLLGERGMEGISCGFCHQVHGPVAAHGRVAGAPTAYEGNATWTSFVTGATFAARPEDARGLTGIGNSGYHLEPGDFLLGGSGHGALDAESDGAHRIAPKATRAYLRSSEFCGSCHDVRLFGTDTLGVAHGEHFKRLRNAYSEWASWASGEARAGRPVSTCQDCHMSSYPGVCEVDVDHDGGSAPKPPLRAAHDGGSAADPECPRGYHFSPRAPGVLPRGRAATGSAELTDVVTHWFSGVDVPLSRELPAELVDEPTVDLHGTPLSARRRRDLLLRHTFRFGLGAARRGGLGLEIPVEIENVGAGHRVPAGFSQEREIWVHLTVRDGDGRLLYEVGRVDRGDEDLRDKLFLRVNVRGDDLDRKGRPLGMFGADVRDGPDVPAWQPPPALGGTQFRGRGLVNFQNGFLRCVRCLGTVAADGHCEARDASQESTRAARFADGDYDLDTGECRSNLTGMNALFETYFPVGALDADRGLAKGPDAIIDTRSLPPRVPIRYVYDLATAGRRGPFKVEARLLFRAFPPFLVKGFAAYEREQARRGLRPSGALVSDDMLGRLEVVEIARAEAEVR